MVHQSRINISVVVPAYNAAATLPSCITALGQQTFPRDKYEIIVVDDGSTDATHKVALASGVILIRQPNRGPAAARNTGIQWAQGDLLLFTDADCVPDGDWIEAMVRPFAAQEVAGCKGIYRTQQHSLVARFVQVEYEEKYRGLERLSAIDFIDTYSAAYRKSVLLREGVFDERIPIGEDADLSWRLAQRGYRLVFNPAAIVSHQHPATIGHYVRRKLRYAVWRWRVYERHPDKIKGDSHTPRNVRWQMLLAAVMWMSLLCVPLLAWAKWLLFVEAALFVATTLPFVARTMKKDFEVALISPFMLWLRAMTLGLGLSYGIICYCVGQVSDYVSLGKHA